MLEPFPFSAEQCSTPFGIRYGITLQCSGRMGCLKSCVLNAFRHQIWNHLCFQILYLYDLVCSTPFGIRYGITFARCVFVKAVITCSTPFGIRYGITRVDNVTLHAIHVLNAFRHQIWNHSASPVSPPRTRTCSTPFGIRYGITEDVLAPESGHFSAQRLSASDMESRYPCRYQCKPSAVLNAFRHQIWNHRISNLLPALRASVLNAFRHQIWNHQEKQPRIVQSRPVCSTPFGIRYGITVIPMETGFTADTCSTPFGIRYGITLNWV